MIEDCNIRVITSLTGLDEVAVFWRANQRKPAIDFDFFKVVVSNRPEIESPCVLVLQSGTTIKALLVGRIERAGFSLRLGYLHVAAVPIRRLVLMDGGWIGNETDQREDRLYRHLPTILKSLHLDLVLIENLQVGGGQYQLLQRGYSWFQLSPAVQPTRHWLMRLPGSWEEFLKLRSKKHRYWLKRIANVLNREFPNRWEIRNHASEAGGPEFVEAAEVIARHTYQRGLGAGFVKNDENLGRVALEAKRGRLRGYVLYVDKQPKAFWYCSVFGQTLYTSATGYDPSFRDYEVGTVLLMQVFQDHCGNGVEWVDFGLGDAGYKQRFGTEHFSETSYLLFSGSVRGLALNLSHRFTLATASVAKWVLDRLKLTQQLKTAWRRRVEQRTAEVAEEQPVVSAVGAKTSAPSSNASHDGVR